jgi:hypothetical protein
MSRNHPAVSYRRSKICVFLISCFPDCPYGSLQTQNFEDAAAHTQGVSPLAASSAQ